MSDPREATVNGLIIKWTAYRSSIPEPDRYLNLAKDLYNVRNSVPGASYPPSLIDPNDEIMASVEHYFLTRGWVGNAIYSLPQVSYMVWFYNTGKRLGVAPRHNPSKPVTPISGMQKNFQEKGIRDGQTDVKTTGKTPPVFMKPPDYF